MFNSAVDVGANDTVLIFVGAFTLSTQTVANVGGFSKHSGYKQRHARLNHDKTLTRSMMVNNTKIIARCPKKRKLAVLKAKWT